MTWVPWRKTDFVNLCRRPPTVHDIPELSSLRKGTITILWQTAQNGPNLWHTESREFLMSKGLKYLGPELVPLPNALDYCSQVNIWDERERLLQMSMACSFKKRKKEVSRNYVVSLAPTLMLCRPSSRARFLDVSLWATNCAVGFELFGTQVEANPRLSIHILYLQKTYAGQLDLDDVSTFQKGFGLYKPLRDIPCQYVTEPTAAALQTEILKKNVASFFWPAFRCADCKKDAAYEISTTPALGTVSVAFVMCSCYPGFIRKSSLEELVQYLLSFSQKRHLVFNHAFWFGRTQAVVVRPLDLKDKKFNFANRHECLIQNL